MSDQLGAMAPGPISVDQLTEAVVTGVLRALSSPAFAKEKRLAANPLVPVPSAPQDDQADRKCGGTSRTEPGTFPASAGSPPAASLPARGGIR